MLDLTIAGIAVGTIALAICIRGNMNSGAIGVALNTVLVANTTLLRLVESFTTLEISLGAVARIKGMGENTPLEDKPHEDTCPEVSWPSAGSVELKQVAAFYE